jgi:anti-anti-sigma factor
MKVSTRTDGNAVVVRVEVARLVYATLDSFVEQVGALVEADRPRVVFDFSPVNYLDSAAIGCLMDLYRRAAAKRGRIALANVVDRVERMLRMTGAHEFIPIYGSAGEAVRALEENSGGGA